MKILQVISYFNPKFGGDVNVCSNLSRDLAKNHHDVTIITTDFDFDSVYADSYRAEGVTVIPFPCIVNLGLFLYTPAINSWLEKNLKAFEIIHLHNYRSYQNNQIRTHAIKSGIPYILQAHGSVLPFSDKKNLKKIYDFVWGRSLLKDSIKVIALTGTETDQYQKMGVPKNKIEIIPNGIDLEKFKYLPKTGKFRKLHGIADECKMILFVGRLHKTKGLDILIDAFHLINQSKIDAWLIIIGADDGYLPQLLKKIQELDLEEKIRILGFISSDEKIAAFNDADVFVTPAYSGFPVTFLEACACGKPIVTTLNGDRLDWIHGKVGYVTNYDADSMNSAITELLTNARLRERFAENGKKTVSDLFSREIITQKVEYLYKANVVERCR